jgi:nucleotide-binding universal stress UspA family protein
MIRSLLIGLDGTDDSNAVVELGIGWARRFDALLVGLGIVDEPGILSAEAARFAGGHHWHAGIPTPLLSHARHKTEQMLQQLARRCEEVGVSCLTLQDVGAPFEQILLEAQCYDLILLGQQTHFCYGCEAAPDETLGKVLPKSPRPVVAVPKVLGSGESIIIAYDGSLPAARALYAFEASGLGSSREVHVVSVGTDHKDAACCAERAVHFLRLHGIGAAAHAVETCAPTSEVILRKISSLEAGLLVMGAYGRSALREFFLGSVSRTLLKESPIAVFCSP